VVLHCSVVAAGRSRFQFDQQPRRARDIKRAIDAVRPGGLETKSGIVIGVSHDNDDIEASHPCAAQSGADQPRANPLALMVWMDCDGSKRQSGGRAALARDTESAETDIANDGAPLICRQGHCESTIISERIDEIGFVGAIKCCGYDLANPLPVSGSFGSDFSGELHFRFKWFRACRIWFPGYYKGDVAG